MWIFRLLLILLLFNSACFLQTNNNFPNQEDISLSGNIAGVIGGAYNGSNSNGTQALVLPERKSPFEILTHLLPLARADMPPPFCPPFNSVFYSACITGADNIESNQTLVYNGCGFGGSDATWNGSILFFCTGTFSTPVIQRQIANGTTRTNHFGTAVQINTLNVPTFDHTAILGIGTTFSPPTLTINGIKLTGTRNGGTLFNQTIVSTTLTLVGRNLTGQVISFDNQNQVTANSIVNINFAPGCCTPTSGTINTTFSTVSGYLPGTGFSNGTTESLSFNGCGSATYSGPQPYSGTVAIANCF